jgi:hypothetical protein
MSGIGSGIEELVGLIHKANPKELGSLHAMFPAFRDVLEPGQRAGIGDLPSKMRAEVALRGMRAARKLCDRATWLAVERLQSANRLEAWTQLFTILSSTGAVVALLNSMKGGVGTAIGASIACLGGLASVGTQFYRRGVLGGADSMIGHLSQLNEVRPKLEELEQELFIALHKETGNFEPDAVKKLVDEANKSGAIVNERVLLIPGAIQP